MPPKAVTQDKPTPARRALYAIGEDLLTIERQADETGGEISEAAAKWLASLEDEEAEKLDGYLFWIAKLEAEQAFAKEQKDLYASHEKVRTNRIKETKEQLRQHLIRTKRGEVATATGKRVCLETTGGNQPIAYAEGVPTDKIDPRFLKVTTEIDSDKVREALKAGEVLEFARFGERSTHVKIR